MKVEILIVTSIFPPQVGGPAIFSARFSQWIDDQHYRSKVITYTIIENTRSENIVKIAIKPNRILAFIKLIIAIIQNSNKNTIIISNGAFIETYIACLVTKRKYIAKIPGDPVWELSKNRGMTLKGIEEFQTSKLTLIQSLFRFLFSLAFKKARFLISPSHQLAAFAQDWGVDKSKIHIIYNCVNPREFELQSTVNKSFDLVTVCRLVPWKGLEELISISSKLNLRLAIIGDGPLNIQLRSMAKKTSNQIRFFGSVPNQDIAEILRRCKVFVLNSEFEATSYALIEAKMCGLPVLAKKTDGSTTLIQNGIDGFIYSSDVIDSFSSVICKLLENDELLRSFGEAGRQDALKRFNQNLNFTKILKLAQI